MKPYEITNLIIDDDFDSEEYVTTEFHFNNQYYSITFKKTDLEIINSWVFQEGTSFPANLSESMINQIREEVKKQI